MIDIYLVTSVVSLMHNFLECASGGVEVDVEGSVDVVKEPGDDDVRPPLEDSVEDHSEEKKENEPFAVPTAGAFYMHDDRFRDNAGACQRYLMVSFIFCIISNLAVWNMCIQCDDTLIFDMEYHS